jgi:hypothetical protein
VITANPTTPTLASLSGVWTLEQQFQNFNVWSPEIVGNSVRLRSSASAYFNRTPSTASNRQTWTWSGWAKAGTISVARALFSAGADGSNFTSIDWRADNRIQLYTNAAGSLVGSIVWDPMVFRDPSAWYHIVIVCNTPSATQTSRFLFYVNGVQFTTISSTGGENNWPAQNANTNINNTVAHSLGRKQHGANEYFDGYLAEVNFVDGQALTPSSFGALDSTGVWQPLPYTGTYGTNGFYLTFADNSAATAAALGKDTSGNGNNWTPNNISLTAGTTYDWMLDSPTNWIGAAGGNGVGNYATLNPIQNPPSGAVSTAYSNGNLQTVLDSSVARSTFAPASGKWYAEFVITSATLSTDTRFAVEPSSGNTFSGNAGQGRAYSANGNKVFNGTSTAYGSTWTQNDVIGCALDLDNGKVWWSKNGTWQASGDPAAGTNEAFSGLSGEFYFTIVNGNSAVSKTFVANFGQRPFTYTPPTGFKALNTLNLPTPTILRGDAYMNATTYTGTGATLSVTNSGSMQPDWVWVKARSQAYNNSLYDSVRGATKELISNATAAEGTTSGVTAFNSNGFTLGTNPGLNENTTTYVGWQWQAGRGTTSSNASGTITSTVSANTTAGFSVVTYTGTGVVATIGHGLGVTPNMMIMKKRSSTSNWGVYHSSIGATGAVFLDTTGATATSSGYFNNTAPTSSVFTVGGAISWNSDNGSTYVAYCFAAVTGYSAFGSYTGNGSTDGPFIYTGFRPRFVLIKATSAAGYNWTIEDTARSTYNASDKILYPSLSNAENSGTARNDILSNGFKARDSSNNNVSGVTYIYACFAENPFNISRAR